MREGTQEMKEVNENAGAAFMRLLTGYSNTWQTGAAGVTQAINN